MRIAIVNERVGAWRGGAETSTLEMAEALKARGAAVTLITSSRDDCTPAADVIECGRMSGSRLAATQSFVHDAESATGAGQFDIVHAVTPLHTADVYQPRGGTYVETVNRSVSTARTAAGRAIKRLGRRLNARQRWLMGKEIELLNRREPPFVAAVSEYVKRQVFEACSIPSDRVCVVFNGVAIEPLAVPEAAERRTRLRKQFGSDDDARVVLFVAHNFKLKGLIELIEAAAVPGCDWTCWVAGRDDATRYRRLADASAGGGRFVFIGSKIPVADLYAAADLLAHPTYYDPCSRVVLEALCCGLPVVTTKHNGAAEVMRAGVHGEIIDTPRDVESLRGAIRSCLSSQSRAACESDAAAMCERLSMSRHARELIALYETALSAKRAGSVGTSRA